VKVTRTVTKTVDGVEQQVEETVEETKKRVEPGCLEAVYHLFSVAKGHGPVVIRMKTVNRTDQVELPSLTPVWRSAEFQEREIFDLFGIIFKGHPDLRRLLMWMSSRIIRCAATTWSPMTLSGSPPRTTRCSSARGNIEAGNRDQGSGIRKKKRRRNNDFNCHRHFGEAEEARGLEPSAGDRSGRRWRSA